MSTVTDWAMFVGSNISAAGTLSDYGGFNKSSRGLPTPSRHGHLKARSLCLGEAPSRVRSVGREIKGPISTSSPGPGAPTTNMPLAYQVFGEVPGHGLVHEHAAGGAAVLAGIFQKPAFRTPAAGARRSASGKTTTGALPPSSRWTRLTDLAAVSALPVR